MQKIAGKPSSDPIQEQLRQAKKSWNKKVSEFIDDLIQYKKILNGAESKFHKEKSSIKNPIPADPTTIIGVLASDFQQIAQEANGIIHQQIDYSKNRRKSKKELGLAHANQIIKLEKLASNKLTRFWNQLKNPISFDDDKKREKSYRLNMLNFCIDIEKDLKNLQNEILNSSAESIFVSSKIINKIEYILKALLKLVNLYAKSINFFDIKTQKDPIKQAPNQNKDFETITKIKEDLLKNKDSFDFTIPQELFDDIEKFPNAEDKLKLFNQINSAYNEILNTLNKKFNTQETSLTNILLESSLVSKAFLGKWLKRKKHQLNPFDKTTSARLDIDKEIQNCLEVIDNCMNSLEKEINVDFLFSTIENLNSILYKMKELLVPIQTSTKGQLYDDKFLTMLENKKLTDNEVEFDDRQSNQLKNMLRRKRMKDMVDLYSGEK